MRAFDKRKKFCGVFFAKYKFLSVQNAWTTLHTDNEKWINVPRVRLWCGRKESDFRPPSYQDGVLPLNYARFSGDGSKNLLLVLLSQETSSTGLHIWEVRMRNRSSRKRQKKPGSKKQNQRRRGHKNGGSRGVARGWLQTASIASGSKIFQELTHKR